MDELIYQAVCVDPIPHSNWCKGTLYQVSKPYRKGTWEYVRAFLPGRGIYEVFAHRFRFVQDPAIDLQEPDPWPS